MNSSRSSIAVCFVLFAASLLSGCDAPVPTEVPPPPAPSQVASRAAPIVVPESESVSLPIGSSRPRPLRLEAGQTAIGKLVAPRGGKLVAFDVKLGNYYNSSTGLLKLELCKEKDQQCTGGSSDLLSSLDNQMFAIVLDEPIHVAAGESLSFRLQKDGGDKEVVVWTYPSTNVEAQSISRKDGKAIDRRTAQLALHYAK